MNVSQFESSVTFATKGQVVVTSAIRKRFEIKAGTRGILAGKCDGKSLVHEWRTHKREEAELED